MTRPVVVSVNDGVEGRRVSISIFQQDPNIPDPVDTTIRKTVVPAGIVYVRLVILPKDDNKNNCFSFLIKTFSFRLILQVIWWVGI